MRAHTITTTTRPRRNAGRLIALVLGICALAIPATASASSDYSSVNSITGSSDESTQPVGSSDYSSPNAIVGASGDPSPVNRAGAHQAPNYSSLNAITGAPSSEPTLVSGSPGNTDDGFDWLSAAIGAAAAMALVALGGAAFLTVRRRTAVAPSAASTS